MSVALPIRTVDRVAADQRAFSFTQRSLKKETKMEGLRLAVSMTDLTTLEGADSLGKVTALCRKALRPGGATEAPSVAAVCVYPRLVPVAKQVLEGTSVHIASVATAFPSGQVTQPSRLVDVREAVAAGADEIDMVISRGVLLAGDEGTVPSEIRAVKKACGPANLKGIMETGELETYDLVRFASDLAIQAGADFIKTSTGKIQPAATMGVTLVMLEAIRDHWLQTGHKVGMKPAGGIRTAKEALHYLVMVKETLGDDWLTPDLFRFGASSLLDDLIMQIQKHERGSYAAAWDVPDA